MNKEADKSLYNGKSEQSTVYGFPALHHHHHHCRHFHYHKQEDYKSYIQLVDKHKGGNERENQGKSLQRHISAIHKLLYSQIAASPISMFITLRNCLYLTL